LKEREIQTKFERERERESYIKRLKKREGSKTSLKKRERSKTQLVYLRPSNGTLSRTRVQTVGPSPP